MRNRVREEIRRYLAGPDLDEGERQRWQDEYSALDAARIGTIHSLCSEILRAHPAEAGVDPRFDTLDEGQGNILLGRVVDQALARAADDAKLVPLFPLLGESGLRPTLRSMLDQRLDTERCLANLPHPLWPVWNERLLGPARAFLEAPGVLDGVDRLQAVRGDGTLDRAAAAGDKLAAPLERLLERWQEISAARAAGDWAAVMALLPSLRGEMTTWGRAALWQPHDPKAVLTRLRALYDGELKAHLGQGIDVDRERRLAEAIPALQDLFAYASTTYSRLKEERQALDFDDLEARALALLRDNDAVRARWQAEVQALLVDEFQDTNGRQRDLVALLNGDRGRLFIVGDAKQSIYRFRGADVVVFRSERQRIQEGGGIALSLETSYRAHRDLIAGLNALLRPVLGEEASPERPWAEPFAPLLPHRQEPGPGFRRPFIELHLALGPKSGGALERAAAALAERIVTLVARGIRVEDRSATRPLGYGDLAILCRASHSFSAYEDALERAGVPFLTVAGRGFYGRAEVRDVLNALQALSDPTDDLALAGLLRSPACGLSDAALFHLCREREARGTCLWDVLERDDGQGILSGPDLGGAARAASLIARLHGQVGRTPVADVLKAFLDETGYRAALIRGGQARGARNVSKLLSDAHASGIVGVGEFLAYVTGLRDTGVREGEARFIAEGAVQIMSVHAAKGLEFPVVIIGDVTRSGGRGGGLLLHPELGPLVPAKDEERQVPAVYRLGKARDDDQQDAESDRLLYVAATRAREMLILNGCLDLKGDGTIGTQRGWLGRLASEDCLQLAGREVACDPEGTGSVHVALQAGSTPISCTIYEQGWTAQSHRLPVAELQPAAPVALPPPLLAPLQPAGGQVDEKAREQEREPVQRVWRVVPTVERPGAPAWVIGSLVHEALASWRFPEGNRAGGNAHAFRHWIEARARSYGLTDLRQLAHAVYQTRRLMLRFRSHQLYRDMDSADRRLHEVPYSLVVEGQVESGIIDALFERAGAWTLVEFKTDRVRDREELDRVLAEEGYLAQAERYVAAAKALLGQEPEIVLCFLNLAGTVSLYRPG